MDARHDGEVGNAERKARSLGTVRPRLVAEEFLRSRERTDSLPDHRVSKSMVAIDKRSGDKRGRVSRSQERRGFCEIQGPTSWEDRSHFASARVKGRLHRNG